MVGSNDCAVLLVHVEREVGLQWWVGACGGRVGSYKCAFLFLNVECQAGLQYGWGGCG